MSRAGAAFEGCASAAIPYQPARQEDGGAFNFAKLPELLRKLIRWLLPQTYDALMRG
jgi:hypothetical protein